MSKPDVGVRWFCQLEMSATEWGLRGRERAAGRAIGGVKHAVNLGEREHGAGGGWLETPVDTPRRAAGSAQGPGGGSVPAKRSRTMRFSRLLLADRTSSCSFCCWRLRISVRAPLRSLFSTMEPWVTQPSL